MQSERKYLQPSDELANLSLVSRVPKPVRKLAYKGLILSTLFSSACFWGEENSDNSPDSIITPEPTAGRQLDENHEFIIPLVNVRDSLSSVYYTGGPHYVNPLNRVRHALDFAGDVPISCPDSEPQDDWMAVASKGGRVITAGDGNDENDPNHSVVEIDHGSGVVTGYMHLANIEVEEGDVVSQGEYLGNLSCESPPGGNTTGQHVHFYLKVNGEIASIDGIELSGWVFKNLPGNYDGIAERSGQSVRTADVHRCGPDATSVAACGGIRNDLDEGEVLGETIEVTPVPTIGPIDETPESEILPEGLYRDPLDAAYAWYKDWSGAEKEDIYLLREGDEFDYDKLKNWCLIERKVNNVAYYIIGACQTEGGGPLFIGQNENGLWEIAYFDEISESLELLLPGAPVKVKNTGGCLNVRSDPSLSGEKLECMIDDTTAEIDEGPVYADGYIWFHLEGRGWSVADYLATINPFDPLYDQFR